LSFYFLVFIFDGYNKVFCFDWNNKKRASTFE